jgi:hypothetical protein
MEAIQSSAYQVSLKFRIAKTYINKTGRSQLSLGLNFLKFENL